MTMIVETMKASDLDSVLSIEKASFSHPWSRQLFLHELNHRHARCYVACLTAFPAPQALTPLRQVVGYAVFRIMAGELHLLKTAVSPEMRKKKIAFHLLGECLGETPLAELEHALLEVRRSNVAAIKLYEKLGFDLIAVRPEYYPLHFGKREDALILRKHLKGGNTWQ